MPPSGKFKARFDTASPLRLLILTDPLGKPGNRFRVKPGDFVNLLERRAAGKDLGVSALVVGVCLRLMVVYIACVFAVSVVGRVIDVLYHTVLGIVC